MIAIFLAAALQLSPEDARQRYRDGQAWADSARGADACLAEINAEAPDPMDISVPSERRMVMIRAQAYAGFTVALIANFRRVSGELSDLDVDHDLGRLGTDDRDELRPSLLTIKAESLALLKDFIAPFPSCRFLEDPTED